jgi:ribosomal protein S18 acetylase RimI-like enzyme
MSDIKQKNINNLISLWKTIGNSFQTQFSQDNINHCYVSNSGWPNRIWFEKELTPEMLNTTTKIPRNAPIPLTVSQWNHYENELHPIFEQIGFVKKSEQIGMSITLQQKINFPNRILLEKVTNEKQATIWAEMYPQSFGYEISEEILIKTSHLIPYYLIHFDEQIIGTVITHKTENVIGMHGLGIIPKFRKQGLAEEVMNYLLNQAIDENIEFATLQSSVMGKSIYLKMGFSQDFLMTNYGFQQN